MSFKFGDVQISGWIDCEVSRGEQLSVRSRPAIACRSFDSRPCDGRDRAIRADAANPVVPEIGNIKIADAIGGKAVGRIELCLRGRSRIAAVPRDSGARSGGDDACGVTFRIRWLSVSEM